jgi:hypothetical protein
MIMERRWHEIEEVAVPNRASVAVAAALIGVTRAAAVRFAILAHFFDSIVPFCQRTRRQSRRVA